MDERQTLLRLRGLLVQETPAEAQRAVSAAMGNRSAGEVAALVSAMRRGMSWDVAVEWLDDARTSSLGLEDGVYDKALELYADSILVEWDECVRVAPGLLYELPPLPGA